jgi:divalent metal cation (Fe/Co/Zn/Cd) transporter
MDPICVETEEVSIAREEVEKIIESHPSIKSMHDFRVVGSGDSKNLVFDIVVFHENTMPDEELKEYIIKSIKGIHLDYNCIITVDRDYH